MGPSSVTPTNSSSTQLGHRSLPSTQSLTGIWNLTNPGVISHNEILEMYRDYVDSNFAWENFTIEEQNKVLAAPRCNNEMDATKLKSEFPHLLSAKESLVKYVFEPNKKIIAA
ncbi:hypothetical protein SLE2022_260820 [Rubroshorea leprosula]